MTTEALLAAIDSSDGDAGSKRLASVWIRNGLIRGARRVRTVGPRVVVTGEHSEWVFFHDGVQCDPILEQAQ